MMNALPSGATVHGDLETGPREVRVARHGNIFFEAVGLDG
jgi:hypothetical protein